MRPIRVLLCDDRELILENCRQILAACWDIQIVAHAGGGYEAVRLADALAPDLIVMDVDMPDLDGIQATRRILAANPSIRVIGHSAASRWSIVRQMIEAGAAGYVVKGGDTAELATAIYAVMSGKRYLSGKVAMPVASAGLQLATHHPYGRPTHSSTEALQVVLVDDSPIVRQRVAAMLSGLDGVQVAGEAGDVAEGMRLVQNRRTDVLIVDLELPPHSGIELLQAAKQHNHELLAIILTSHDHPKLRKWCAELGADFFFHKATEFEQLLCVCQDLARSRGRSVPVT